MISNKLVDLAKGQYLQNWLVLGPFVVKTSDHFEREYMYERARILDIDYLEGEGGEASVRPVLGQSHANIGLGPKRLQWREYPDAYLSGTRIAGEIIYETVQRNCVIYAATTIEAEGDTLAVLDAYHSGMKAWVNGARVCNIPYGLAKGVRMSMPSVPIKLRKGANLILFKFRPGYICDGIDFCVCNATVAPLASKSGLPIALGRVHALPHFQGTPDAPRQLIEAALLNNSNAAHTVRVSLVMAREYARPPDSETPDAEASVEVICAPHELVPVRLSLPAPRDKAGATLRASYRAKLHGETLDVPFEYVAGTPPKYDGTVLVLSSFHFDTTYHEEQRVYAMGAFDLVRQYCALHRTDPLFRSIISEVDYLKPYFDVYPEDRETLLRIFREKRSEPDVMYNQPNEQTCGDEGLVRNFLYGQLIHGRVFGNICHAYGPGDVFGHPNQLSQIAKKSGCIGVTWGKHIFNFPPFFNHLSLDGTTLPHQRGDASEDDVHEMGLSVRLGDIDQSPPTAWHHTLTPVHQQGTYYDLMSTIHQEVQDKGAHLPVTSRDMSLYHAATAVSRVDLKISNRLGENLLLDAEKFATLAALLGGIYPGKALDKAWRQLLCGQHHDSITGTHNEISFVDLMNSYRETLELGTAVVNQSLDYLSRAIDTSGAGIAYVVFNSLAWERTDVVRARIAGVGTAGFTLANAQGARVPFEVVSVNRDRKGNIRNADIAFVAGNMPSLGYRTYRVAPSNEALPERQKAAGTQIENEHYRITADPARGGGLIGVFDKAAKREVIDASRGHLGNEVAILEEVAWRNETQHEFYTSGLKMFSGDSPASVEVEQGPVSATLRARYAMGELCEVVQEITLFQGVKRIECRTILLDVQREDYLFCVTFPTNLKGLTPVFDERFGVVARNDSKHYLDFRTHQMMMFSDCAVYAANKWMEYGSCAQLHISGAEALRAPGKHAYALSMIGLITPKDKADVAVAETIQQTLIKKGVTCTPWYDKDGPHWGSYLKHMDDDLLYTRFRFSIGSRGKNRYSKKLIEAQSAEVRKAFDQRLLRDGYACLLVKDAGLKDTSWPPVPVLIVEAATNKDLAQAIATLLADFSKSAAITLPLYVDATGEKHVVDDYGVALLNTGTYANSIEKGGVLCMILGHTCRWYGGTNNFTEGSLVPENKNHVYTYALYPHAGDWRQANTPHAGYEFNHRLMARKAVPAAKPSLPPEMSFVSVEPKNVILSAMKPFGNPIAAFEQLKAADPRDGIMMRLYDTEGVASAAHVAFSSGMKAAWAANLLEERQAELVVDNGGLTLAVPAFSIETIGFEPGKLGKAMARKALGPNAEPVQPVWVRSWEHDAESMPMGYGSVVCSISREVKEAEDGRVLKIKINAVNDYTDAEVSVTAGLLVPGGWTASVSSIPFQIGPLGYKTADITVRRPGAQAAGQIKLRFDYDGQTFQDVLEIGSAFNLEMSAENQGDAIVVTVTNPTNEAIEAEVSLVSPIETWPETLAGPYALSDISPRTYGMSLAAGASQTLRFTVTPQPDASLVPRDSYWAVAKLMSNGRIQLKRCDNRPPERRMWSDKWFRGYFGRSRY